jgi:hypothetical protein
MAGSSPTPATQHQRRAYLPGRQLCELWQQQPPKPPSRRPIGIDGIVGTGGIVGIDTIIGTVAIIGIGTIIGARITVATIITGIPFIGNSAEK